MIGDQPRHNVGGGAGTERHHDLDRLGRPVLRRRGHRCGEERQQREGEKLLHVVSLGCGYFGCGLFEVAPEIGAVLFKQSLQGFNWNFSERELPESARCAAVPAAWPITKQRPLTRAADWPSCVIEAQRPATRRFPLLRQEHPVGQVIEAARRRNVRPQPFDVA